MKPFHSLVLAAGLIVPAATALAETPATIIVMDGSGSMWGQIDGRPKLEIARETVREVLGQIPADQALGLLAYGHREKGNCGDIELMVPPAQGTAGQISDAVGAMRFLGKTPLSDAVRQAAEALRYQEAAATVVLVTDGLETCSADPCALGRELEAAGLNFTAHVIGFGLSQAEGAQVACLAQETGGRYFEAGDAEALSDALTATVAAPEPLPEAPKTTRSYFPGAALMEGIALSPTGGTTGAAEVSLAPFDFARDGTIAHCAAQCDGDAQCAAWRYEPPGSLFVEEARCFTYGASSEMDYSTYPLEEGWASGIKDGTLMLIRPWVVQEALPEAALTASPSAAIGATVQIGWTGPAAELDTVEIGLPGDGECWAYAYVASGNPVSLIMPGEPGDYELRYKFRDHTVIATLPIAVTEAPVTITASDQALAGAEVAIHWTGPDADYDTIQIGPAGSDSYVTYGYIRDANPLILTMPEEPGLYELRYKLSDTQVIGTRSIEVLPAGAALPDPATDAALAPVPIEITAETGGLDLAVTWSATPVAGQGLPPEVWVMNHGVAGPVGAAFLPGRYDVRGDAGDTVFAGQIEVVAGGENRFTIPVSAELSPAGEDEPSEATEPATAEAPGAAPVTLNAWNNSRITLSFEDGPTGLGFALPPGWGADEPFFYETAGGVRADNPTMGFWLRDDPAQGALIMLNPIRQAPGPCIATDAGDLCHVGTAPALAAAEAIAPTLSLKGSAE